MAAEADEGLPTTTTGSNLKGGAIAALRWVYPAHHLVTALTGSVTVGRSPSCTTALESASVSRQHAAVKSVSSAWVIRDLDSKNGVFVNAKKVRESPLRIGDVVRLGDWVGVVEATTIDGLQGFRDLGYGVFGGAALVPVVELVKKAALAGSDLLLVGETGTGKALLARALHRFAALQGPFVVFDCTAGSDDLREAELLGGGEAPTPAKGAGQVLAARGGTLLLDSPFDLPAPLQAKLARLLERRALEPQAGKLETALDVRIVAKTSVAPDDLPPGRIDSELRRIFAGSTVRVPALRERRADIVPLFMELVQRHGHETIAKLEPDMVERLCLQEWPMNVRELDRKARRFLVEGALEQGTESAFDGSENDRTTAPPSRRVAPSYSASEIQALRAALERHQGNLSKAADELEITRSKAYRMLKSAR
jgi:transcriptional regulator of acetoin/glycerol metabolism